MVARVIRRRGDAVVEPRPDAEPGQLDRPARGEGCARHRDLTCQPHGAVAEGCIEQQLEIVDRPCDRTHHAEVHRPETAGRPRYVATLGDDTP